MKHSYCSLVLENNFDLEKWAASWQNQQNGMCAQRRLRSAWVSAQSDQGLRCLLEESLSYPLSAQRRLWSDWADAQADLSLRRAHIPFCWFCHDAAQIGLLGQTIFERKRYVMSPCDSSNLSFIPYMDKNYCSLQIKFSLSRSAWPAIVQTPSLPLRFSTIPDGIIILLLEFRFDGHYLIASDHPDAYSDDP